MTAGYYSDDETTTRNLDGAGFVLVHWVLEGGNGKNHLYVNGAEITGSPADAQQRQHAGHHRDHRPRA